MRLSIALFVGAAAAINPEYLFNANDGITALQRWYHTGDGTWDKAQWWQQANVLTTVSEFAKIQPSFMGNASTVYDTTFHKLLGNPNKRAIPGRGRDMFEEAHQVSSDIVARGNDWSRFDNGLFDDPGWWALAWISAFDVTNNGLYLVVAQNILENILIKEGTPSRCNNGGINWRKNNSYVNAITNELYLTIAARLATRSSDPAKKAMYLQKAKDQWNWFKSSGMINSDSLINDGLNNDCKNDGSGPIWTYNQGVILGGLVELNKASPDPTLITTANAIAKAAITKMTDSNSGVLKESCDAQNNCNADQRQFKGIFVRNLMYLNQVSPSDTYKNFFKANADSIWSKARLTEDTFVVNWAGPVTNDRWASSTSSAIDALIAAAACT